MTAVYSVFNGEDAVYFRTKREASAYAKELAADDETGTVFDVDRCEIGLRGRALLIAALNGTGWVIGRTTVASFQGREAVDHD